MLSPVSTANSVAHSDRSGLTRGQVRWRDSRRHSIRTSEEHFLPDPTAGDLDSPNPDSPSSSLFSGVPQIKPNQTAHSLHHAAASSWSHKLESIDFSIRNTLSSSPLSFPIFRNLKGNIEEDFPEAEQIGLSAENQQLKDTYSYRSPPIGLESFEQWHLNSEKILFPSSSSSSLGSPYLPYQPALSRLFDKFEALAPNKLQNRDLKGVDLPVYGTYIGTSDPWYKATADIQHGFFSKRNLNKRIRQVQAQHNFEERRRVRQLVFFFASFIISGLFLLGIIIITLERKPTQENLEPFHIYPSTTFEIEAPERDTLIIYRIIGNDLPPRHSPRQTLTNLQFILENESDFNGLPSLIRDELNPVVEQERQELKLKVKKIYVLNRIFNQTQLEVVKSMLKSYGVTDEQILVNPFVIDIYRSQPFDSMPDIGWNNEIYAPWGIDKTSKQSGIVGSTIETSPSARKVNDSIINTTPGKWRALEFSYRSKNLYAMNNNGGRNFALEHGRSLPEARWILPLDGNCFFTPASLYSLVISLRDSEFEPVPSSHVIIPMKRLIGNDEAEAQNTQLDHSMPEEGQPQRPPAPDEPQVGFRFSSREIYSPEMRYGRRSKLEFLWRLGAIDRNRNLDKKTNDWELTEKSILTTQSYGIIRRADNRSDVKRHGSRAHKSSFKNNQHAPDFFHAGWVLRLFSGDQRQEEYTAEAISRRSLNRMRGIVFFLEGVDEAITRGPSTCRSNYVSEHCGFADWRLWTINSEELMKLKSHNTKGDSFASELVESLLELSEPLKAYTSFALSKAKKGQVKKLDLAKVSKSIFVLALVSYLRDDSKYADMAASLTNAIFLQSNNDSVPTQLNAQLHALRLQENYEGFGYAFPISRHENSLPEWMKDTNLSSLPFDPYTFDPTFLLDGIRLLKETLKQLGTNPKNQRIHESISAKLPQQRLKEIFKLQISHLLLSDSLIQQLFEQNSNKLEGFKYAIKLSVLASFTDDVRLLNRILNRTPVGYSMLSKRETGDSMPPMSENLVFRQEGPTVLLDISQHFRQGLRNIKLQRLGILNLSSSSNNPFPTFETTLESLSNF